MHCDETIPIRCLAHNTVAAASVSLTLATLQQLVEVAAVAVATPGCVFQ
jgi:hypothetical protein